MLMRKLTTTSAAAAAVLSAVTGAALPVTAQTVNGMPRPPGVRLGALPRLPAGQPGEVSVAVNPRNPRHLVVSYQQIIVDSNTRVHYGERANVRVAWSADGGETWSTATGTTHDEYVISVDASVAMDLHGHAFLGFMAFDHFTKPYVPGPIRGAPRNGIFVRRSLDGGRTWEASHTALIEYPTMQDAPFQDKGYLVADNNPASPYAGNLYMGWTSYSLEKSEILFARSTDDGKTWSKPMAISTDPGVAQSSVRGALLGFHAAMGRDGAVYTTWVDGKAIVLAVSHDGGRTFEPSRRIIPTKSWALLDAPGFPFAAGFPAIATDPRGSPGKLFVVWGDNPYGDNDVLASTSDDGGRTWTSPFRVNDDPQQNGTDQVLSWVTVDPTDGAAYAVFYDRRMDPKRALATVTLARSTDGGRTFVNYAWTTTLSDPKRANHGDYIGIAALGGRVYGAWVESAPPLPEIRVPVTPHFPSGPALIRTGVADFRGAGRVNGQDARRRH